MSPLPQLIQKAIQIKSEATGLSHFGNKNKTWRLVTHLERWLPVVKPYAMPTSISAILFRFSAVFNSDMRCLCHGHENDQTNLRVDMTRERVRHRCMSRPWRHIATGEALANRQASRA